MDDNLAYAKLDTVGSDKDSVLRIRKNDTIYQVTTEVEIEPTIQTFTSSGNFIVPDGCTSVNVIVVGGGTNGSRGNNGGKVVRTSATSSYGYPGSGGSGGKGGNGGEIKTMTISGLTPQSIIPITVGGIGGDSSFGSYILAKGGGGAVGQNGSGGTASPGDGIGGYGGNGGKGGSGYNCSGGMGGSGAISGWTPGYSGGLGVGGSWNYTDYHLSGKGGYPGENAVIYGAGGGGGGGGGGTGCKYGQYNTLPAGEGGPGGLGSQGVVIISWL